MSPAADTGATPRTHPDTPPMTPTPAATLAVAILAVAALAVPGTGG